MGKNTWPLYHKSISLVAVALLIGLVVGYKRNVEGGNSTINRSIAAKGRVTIDSIAPDISSNLSDSMDSDAGGMGGQYLMVHL